MPDFQNILIAAHNAAKRYPDNGIVGLGQVIGHRNVKTFANNLNPNDDKHTLTLVEFLHVLRETQDMTLMRSIAMLAACAVERGHSHDFSLKDIPKLVAKECSEAIIAGQQQCCNRREEDEVIREFDEAIDTLTIARDSILKGRTTG
jgi:hypothetical protein